MGDLSKLVAARGWRHMAGTVVSFTTFSLSLSSLSRRSMRPPRPTGVPPGVAGPPSTCADHWPSAPGHRRGAGWARVRAWSLVRADGGRGRVGFWGFVYLFIYFIKTMLYLHIYIYYMIYYNKNLVAGLVGHNAQDLAQQWVQGSNPAQNTKFFIFLNFVQNKANLRKFVSGTILVGIRRN